MFKKILIYEDTRSYKTALHNAKVNIAKFNDLKTEVLKYTDLPTTKEDQADFFKDVTSYVTVAIKQKYSSKIDIPLSSKKLLELLEIDLSKLTLLASKVNFKNLEFNEALELETTINIERFRFYTTNQAQNTRYKNAVQLIELFTELCKKGTYNKNLHELSRASDRKLVYDSNLGTLRPDVAYILKG